eukprot:TRINITY_DN14606_c0_g1_i6.p1 TRINITY_DN14606_c0_g1~~TRINITY_DN14606_c0_g1_i6.p1  ORF type:complete len:279 (-),score=70.06 TRINITY_DN14606_c0_g1_i6:338-1174(-)
MLLAASTDMPDDMRKICTRVGYMHLRTVTYPQAMVRGFNDACAEAETTVTGGQTVSACVTEGSVAQVLNPWPIIGGVATSLCTEDEFVSPDGALVGDVVVVTKPMGTQVAVNLWQWCKKDNAHWKQCVAAGSTDEEKARLGMHKAVESMGRLNRNAAKLMIKYGAHAATDVTGFGIMGHAQNLSENQQAEVGIEIHTLPCIAGMCAVGDACGIDFKLREGYSAETSGGLMICLPAEAAAAFCEEYQQIDGMPAWEIGRVVASAERKSCIVEGCQIVEV